VNAVALPTHDLRAPADGERLDSEPAPARHPVVSKLVYKHRRPKQQHDGRDDVGDVQNLPNVCHDLRPDHTGASAKSTLDGVWWQQMKKWRKTVKFW
jgi:hypothetical protein